MNEIDICRKDLIEFYTSVSSLDKDSLKEKSLLLDAKWNNLADSISYFKAKQIPEVIFIGIRSLNRFRNDPLQIYSEKATNALVDRIIASLRDFNSDLNSGNGLFLTDKEYYKSEHELWCRYYHLFDEVIPRKRLGWDVAVETSLDLLHSFFKNFELMQDPWVRKSFINLFEDIKSCYKIPDERLAKIIDLLASVKDLEELWKNE